MAMQAVNPCPTESSMHESPAKCICASVNWSRVSKHHARQVTKPDLAFGILAEG